MTAPRSPSVRTLAKLWAFATAQWLHRWTSAAGELPVDADGRLTVAAAFWAQDLAGFDEATILGAMRAFAHQGNDWPPTLPQLRALCAGIPSLEHVRQQFRGDKDPAGFARLVWSYVDSYQLSRAPQDQADRLVRDAYNLARENVLSGRATIPDDEQRSLQAPERRRLVPAKAEVVQANLEQIARTLGVGDPLADYAPAVELSADEEAAGPPRLSEDARALMHVLDRKSAAAGERIDDDEVGA